MAPSSSASAISIYLSRQAHQRNQPRARAAVIKHIERFWKKRDIKRLLLGAYGFRVNRAGNGYEKLNFDKRSKTRRFMRVCGRHRRFMRHHAGEQRAANFGGVAGRLAAAYFARRAVATRKGGGWPQYRCCASGDVRALGVTATAAAARAREASGNNSRLAGACLFSWPAMRPYRSVA